MDDILSRQGVKSPSTTDSGSTATATVAAKASPKPVSGKDPKRGDAAQVDVCKPGDATEDEKCMYKVTGQWIGVSGAWVWCRFGILTNGIH